MTSPEGLKIAFIGGGSYFTMHLLHGMAMHARELAERAGRIELVLMDTVPANAERRRAYAGIVAGESGLPLVTTVTADRDRAIEGADWVIFCIPLPPEAKEMRDRRLPGSRDPNCEFTPNLVIEAEAYWPTLEEFGRALARLSPGALFSTVINPTDVLAAAFQRAFGIRSAGICVEGPQLQLWLAHLLKAPVPEIVLEHIGANHVGWVSRWTVSGRDGDPLLAKTLDEVRGTDAWNPRFNWFADVFKSTGHMRMSQYHSWPSKPTWGPKEKAGHRRYLDAVGADVGLAWREKVFAEAEAAGKMVPDLGPPEVHYERRAYIYMNARRTFGAIALGLAGGAAGPVPLQTRNDACNPGLPEDAWLEVPTVVEKAALRPRTVPLPRPQVFEETERIIRERVGVAARLAGQFGVRS